MAITSASVLNVAPELSSVSADRMSWAITYANATVSDTVLGAGRADLARAYLAAHMLSVKNSGAVTSESVGGVSRSYAVSSSDVDSTPYGKTYRQLLRRHAYTTGVL